MKYWGEALPAACLATSRSKKGLAYSVYGSLGSSYYHPGLFRAGLQTKSSTTTPPSPTVKA